MTDRRPIQAILVGDVGLPDGGRRKGKGVVVLRSTGVENEVRSPKDDTVVE